MSLKKLIVSNFKSYAGDLEIPFEGTPFVAIVGPNGSGKSNLLDAICFVVGLELERMRCKSIKDLMYKSSKLDVSVTAHIETADGDKRTFKRTSKEFLFNNKSMNHEEYCYEWAKLNVFPGARNCIFLQGDIDSLARMGPEELADLIETMQTSTSVKEILSEKSEYEAIESELAKTAAESRKFISARRSAQSKINHAQDLNDSKEKLNELKAKLNKLEKRRKILISAEKRATLKAMKLQIKQAQSEVDERTAEVELMDVDSKKLRSEYARKRRQLQASRNAEQEASDAAAEAEAALKPLQRKLAAIETEQRLHNPDLEYSKQSLQTAEMEVKAAERALQLLDRAHERIQSGSESSCRASPESARLRDLWSKLESEFITETALKQDAIDLAKQQINATSHRLHVHERKADERDSEVNLAISRMNQQELRVSQLKNLLSERRNQKLVCKQDLETLAQNLQELHREQQETSAKVAELTKKIRAADSNKQALAQRHCLLDTVEKLRRYNPGVLDLLGNLVSPVEERFAVALERGLGSHVDSIVVDTVETAKCCIAQAKRDRLGVYTFLPLKNLQSKELSTARALLARRTVNGNEARLLIDCCVFDQEIRPALIHALGDTAFTPSFRDGLNLRRNGANMRIIDVHGSTISRSNIITTSLGMTSESVQASDRFVASMQRKAHSLAERLKSTVTEENELTDREIKLSSQLECMSQIIESTEEELAVAELQLDSAKRAVDYLGVKDASESEELNSMREDLRMAQAKLDELQEDLNSARLQKFQNFISEAGGTLAQWDAKFAAGAQRHVDLSRQLQKLEDRLKLANERRDSAASLLDAHMQRQCALEKAKKKTLIQQSIASEEITVARQKLERAQARVHSLRDEIESKSEEMGAAETALEEARFRISEAEHAQHKHSIALAAELGESDIDDDNESDFTSPFSDSANESETETVSHRVRKRKRVPQSNGREVLNIDRLDSKIRELKAEIEPLAALVAAMRGQGEDADVIRASQVCANLDRTAEIARSKYDLLSTHFAELKASRTARFNGTLEKIQNHLSSVYSELIGSEAQAKLTAIQRDAPFSGIEFSVMLPGKPFAHISQMSGGERSMAALALLFACQRLHSAPFVALDEVDAALDFANVASVSKYIRSNCVSTQFIMVSLKQRMFHSASHLVGVYKEKSDSNVLTVAL